MNMARNKKMVTLTLSPEIVERLENWLKGHEFPPAKNLVIEAALKNYLDEKERESNGS
jgi:predicted DNA-binding protein